MPASPKEFAPDVVLSPLWRIRSSSNQVVELKMLLENLNDMARLLVSPDYRVIYTGMQDTVGYTNTDKQEIGISWEYLQNETYPIPPEKVDVLLGTLMHEIGHAMKGDIWAKQLVQMRSRKVGNKTYSQQPHFIPTQAPDFQHDEPLWFASCTLLDANIDSAMIREHPLRGAYIMRGRKYSYDTDQRERIYERLNDHSVALSWKMLAYAWMACLIYYDDHVIDLLADRPDFNNVYRALDELIKLGIKASGLKLVDPVENEDLKKMIRRASAILHEYDEAQNPPQQQPEPEEQPQPPQQSQMQTPPQQGAAGGQQQQGDADDDAGESGEGESEDKVGEDGGSETEAEREEQPHKPEPDEADTDGDDDFDDWDDNAGADAEDGDAKDDTPAADDTNGISLGCPAESSAQKSKQGQQQQASGSAQMPSDLAQQVFAAIEKEMEDVTAQTGVKTIMIKPELDLTIGNITTESTVSQLAEATEVLKEMATQRTLGLPRGKLSNLLIDRVVHGDPHIFERHDIIADVDLSVGLVLDASSSIRFDSWKLMQETVDGFVGAFGHRHDIDLFINAYNTVYGPRGNYDTVHIYRIFEPGWEFPRMKDVHPDGSTPTLPGLKMALSRMREVGRPRQRQLIIHVTDGEPNIGGDEPDVRRWVSETEKQGISTIGIGVGLSGGYRNSVNRGDMLMAEQYRTWFNIDAFDELPQKLKEIMVEVLLV